MNKKIFDIYDEHFSTKEKVFDKYPGSPKLQSELEELNKVSEYLKSLASVTIDENYFTNILPRFRESQQNKKYKFTFNKLVASTSVAFSTIIILLLTFHYVQKDTQVNAVSANPEIITSITPVQENSYIASADQFAENVANDTSVQQEIDKSIYQSLAAQPGENNYALIKSDNDYDKVLSQLDDEELETVYAQLQQTKIL